MKYFFVISFAFLFLQPSFAQTGFDSLAAKNILQQQADSMVQLLSAKDYKKFVKYIYPAIIKGMGGETKMIAILEKGLDQLKSEGFVVNKVTIGEPSAFVKVGNEIQCTIPEILELKASDGKLVTKSILIAVSNNGGKKWYFIDTSNKDLQAMRKLLPNLSKDLIIPKKEQPVFYSE